tara:strand:- start:1193 stop:2140 length:948 start_codon:yes stop_codon:yes gene_type:complete
MSVYRNTLRLLLIDTYPLQSRKEFLKNGIPLATHLYKRCIQKVINKKYKDTQLKFNTIYPTEMTLQEIDNIHKRENKYTYENKKIYDGSLWTGSSLNIDDSSQKKTIYNQMKLIESLFINEIPSFGSCWGLQLLATMQGGICKKMDKPREFGFSRKIELTDKGRNHFMYKNKNNVFDSFGNHSYEVTYVPESVNMLSTSQYCKTQSVSVIENNTEFCATQYHPEYTLPYVSKLFLQRKKRAIENHLFFNEYDIHRFSNNLEYIENNKNKTNCELYKTHPITWLYGIDNDILSSNYLSLEIENWIDTIINNKNACL